MGSYRVTANLGFKSAKMTYKAAVRYAFVLAVLGNVNVKVEPA